MVQKKDKNLAEGRLVNEIEAWRQGFKLVVGTDEAGRGPLAGPVCAGAAAIIDRTATDDEFRFLLAETNDSKILAPAKREAVYGCIVAHPAIIWGFAAVSPRVIDKINILEASRLAMKRAIGNMLRHFCVVLPQEKIFCLVDGNKELRAGYRQRAVVGGDRAVFSISAASIIAKVGRDRLMAGLDKKYPGYGFAIHKGYGTSRHLEALEHLGPSLIHRKTFFPVVRAQKKFSTARN